MDQSQRPLQRDPEPLTELQAGRTETLCVLTVHDESYSKNDVLLNPSLFPDGSLAPGNAFQVVTSRSSSSVQDFQQSPSSLRPSSGQTGNGNEDKSGLEQEPLERQKSPLPTSSKSEPAYVFIVSEGDLDSSNKFPNLQISVSTHIANLHGLKNRTNVFVRQIRKDVHAATHVELSFREAYLTRDDMWRLTVSELTSKSIYEDKKSLFLGTIRATVRKIYTKGRRVPSAIFTDATKPIFRSESARFILYIQMSKEMWQFDPQNPGETMFDQVVDGFLPRLFAKWDKLNARHIVSIVLFTRMEYNETSNFTSVEGEGAADDSREPLTQDFYRVVLSERSSVDSDRILYKLKKEFKTFLKDLSTHPSTMDQSRKWDDTAERPNNATNIVARPTSCIRGNILEAINLASMRFSRDFVDRDLVRTGVSIVVISPGTGVFQVEEQSLRFATENLANVAIGIDLVCLSQLPLHSVPLFMYRRRKSNHHLAMSSVPEHDASSGLQTLDGGAMKKTKDVLPPEEDDPDLITWSYAIPHWVDISFWTRGSLLGHRGNTLFPSNNAQDFTPRCRLYELQMMGLMETEKSNVSIPYLSETSSDAMLQSFKPFNHLIDDTYASSPDSINDRPHGDAKSGLRAQDIRKRFSGTSKVRDTREEAQFMDAYDKHLFVPSKKAQSAASKHNQRRIRTTAAKPTKRPEIPFGSDSLRDSPSSNSIFVSPRESFLDQHMRDKGTTQVDGESRAKSQTKENKPNSIQDSASQARSQQRYGSLKLLGRPGRESGKALASTNWSLDHASSSKVTSNKETESGSVSESKYRVSDHVRASLSRHALSGSEQNMKGTQPISIQKPAHNPKSAQRDSAVIQEPQEKTVEPEDSEKVGHSQFEMDGHRLDTTKSSPQELTSSSPQDLQTPWLVVKNVSNPHQNEQSVARQFRRWQNVFPRPPRASRLKWKSLCSPAALPLTGENRPSYEQLHEDFEESTYKILPNDDESTAHGRGPRTKLLKQLVGFRLARGFQVVPDIRTSNIPGARGMTTILDQNCLSDDSVAVFMMRGSAVHLLCAADSEVQVTRYDLRHSVRGLKEQIFYSPFIRTELNDNYLPRPLTLKYLAEEPNWNAIDNHLAGYEVNAGNALQYWRARFVLIPNEPPSSARRFTPVMAEDSDDEIYIEGVQRLTQLFEKLELSTSDGRGFQTALSRRKDPNPLGLEFQTRDASAVVAAGLETSRLLEGEASAAATQLFAASEAHRLSTVDLQKLAQDLQGEKGIRIRDRRWYFRLHLYCFVGFDLTTWLLHNFKDVESREEAAELGNALMQKGLFHHVTKKHVFRDGNFFYAIANDYRIPRSDAQGWFSRKGDGKSSVPSTPLPEMPKDDNPHSDRPETRSGLETSRTGEHSSSARKPKPKVKLSEVLEYDVDHKKKSDRAEVVHVHYDKLYNPDSCYHFRIDWMNVTPKLVEDTVANWSATVERFGLRLVELPISESCGIAERHPFRDPYTIRLALAPPSTQPQTYFDNVSLGPQASGDPFIYHRLLLRKFGFILDVEAASNFPADVEVTYSWGKPDYKFNQYIHKSGVVIAQVNDQGEFLLLANRLCMQWTNSTPSKESSKYDRDKSDLPFDRRPTSNMRSRHSTYNIDRSSPFASPHVRAVADMHPSPMLSNHDEKEKMPLNAEQIKDQFETFCHNSKALSSFYEEMTAPLKSPTGDATPTLEANIPSFGDLPPSIAGVLGTGSSVLRDSSTGRRSKGSDE